MDSPVYYKSRMIRTKFAQEAGLCTYEFEVLEGANDLLGEGLSTLLECRNLVRLSLLELLLDLLHVILGSGNQAY